jgi:hypothetical protein
MFKNSLKIAAIIFVVGVSVAAQAPTVVRTVKISHDLALNNGFVSNLVTVEIPVGGREGRHKHAGTLPSTTTATRRSPTRSATRSLSSRASFTRA